MLSLAEMRAENGRPAATWGYAGDVPLVPAGVRHCQDNPKSEIFLVIPCQQVADVAGYREAVTGPIVIPIQLPGSMLLAAVDFRADHLKHSPYHSVAYSGNQSRDPATAQGFDFAQN
jgi:hypothetical protein